MQKHMWDATTPWWMFRKVSGRDGPIRGRVIGRKYHAVLSPMSGKSLCGKITAYHVVKDDVDHKLDCLVCLSLVRKILRWYEETGCPIAYEDAETAEVQRDWCLENDQERLAEVLPVLGQRMVPKGCLVCFGTGVMVERGYVFDGSFEPKFTPFKCESCDGKGFHLQMNSIDYQHWKWATRHPDAANPSAKLLTFDRLVHYENRRREYIVRFGVEDPAEMPDLYRRILENG